QRKKQRKDEHPKHYFRLALQFEHARHQKMGVAGPAAITPWYGGLWPICANRGFLGGAHIQFVIVDF
ncbi:MAG TPA: hypothetical protein VJQ82_18805, partial [Terriglobales bacterium]|nr:hypothetical protein [Terriglobales bacterium]